MNLEVREVSPGGLVVRIATPSARVIQIPHYSALGTIFEKGEQGEQNTPKGLYVKELRASGNPAKAGKVFDFSRETELVDEWKKRVRKL